MRIPRYLRADLAIMLLTSIRKKYNKNVASDYISVRIYDNKFYDLPGSTAPYRKLEKVCPCLCSGEKKQIYSVAVLGRGRLPRTTRDMNHTEREFWEDKWLFRGYDCTELKRLFVKIDRIFFDAVHHLITARTSRAKASKDGYRYGIVVNKFCLQQNRSTPSLRRVKREIRDYLSGENWESSSFEEEIFKGLFLCGSKLPDRVMAMYSHKAFPPRRPSLHPVIC